MRWTNEEAPVQATDADPKCDGERAGSVKSSFSDRAFIGHLSHELRTPMNGVIGMTELLAKAPGLTSEYRGLVDEIQESSGALWDVVSDFLDYAQLESGTLKLVPEAFDPHGMVKAVIAQMAANAEHMLLEIAGYVDPGVSHSFNGDVSRLRQALANFIAAAIKLSRSGGIVVRALYGEETQTAATLRLEVEAAGARVPTSKLQRLFEPFTLSDYSVSRRDAGTGLGLAVAERLVRLMGGSTGVEPGPDDGCTLWLETGLAPRAANNAPVSDLHSQFAGKRVLLAMENPRLGTLLLQQLRDVGLDGEQATTSEKAIQALKSRRGQSDAFHLAILDRGLLGLDGLALARDLYSQGLTDGVKLLLLSPVTQQADPADLQGLPVARELIKPVAADRLYGTLETLFFNDLREAPEPCLETDTRPKAASAPSARILVAEDNPVNRNLVKYTLEYAGYRVVEVENGQEAIDACKAEVFDLILMDCQMPLVDGCSAAEEIRIWEEKRATGGRIPIIAVTANALEDDRRKCMAAGMDDFLGKPFHQNELFRLLQQWLPATAQEIEE